MPPIGRAFLEAEGDWVEGEKWQFEWREGAPVREVKWDCWWSGFSIGKLGS